MRARLDSSECQLQNLQKKIDSSVIANGVVVDTDLHQDLLSIMEEHTPAIHEEFPEGSFK